MCFNPAISLGTFLIEFILATFILFRYRKTNLAVFSAIILYVLGLYQFTEFMLCTSSSPLLWARLGFIAYTFLPALGLHEAFSLTKRKFPSFVFYILPVLFALFAVFHPAFVAQATCNTVFVTVDNVLSDPIFGIEGLLSTIYGVYYAAFIIAFSLIFLADSLGLKDKKKRTTYRLIFLASLLMSVPTFIVVIVFPALSIRFASVLCHFALLTAITVFIAVYLENKK